MSNVNSATTPAPAAGTTAEPEAEIADVDMLLIWPKLGADSVDSKSPVESFPTTLGKTIQGPHPGRTECIRSLSRLPMSPKKVSHNLHHPRRNGPQQIRLPSLT